MTPISASLVKELREKTGVGMMDCKKALEETNGDFDAAIKTLREKGLAAANKKADRSTKEGKVFVAISSDKKKAAIVEINCETDFVSNNDAFLTFGDSIANALIQQQNIQNTDQIADLKINSQNATNAISEAVLKLGENIGIKQLQNKQSNGQFASYSHMNGNIGVLVEFSGNINDETAKDIAMQIAATSPLSVRPEDLSTDHLEAEKDIIRTQLKNEGKPEQIIDKILEGKIKKYYSEVCLLEQEFVKDSDKKIKDLLPKDVSIAQFIRYSVK